MIHPQRFVWTTVYMKFSLDKNFAKPSNLCIAEILNFRQCSKDRHILYVIINAGQKIRIIKISPMRADGEISKIFLLAKIWYTAWRLKWQDYSHFHCIETTLHVMLTSSQVLTERKSFETVVRSSLPAMVDPRVVSVALELPLLPSVALTLSLLSSVV